MGRPMFSDIRISHYSPPPDPQGYKRLPGEFHAIQVYTSADFNDSSCVRCETSISCLLFYKLYESPVVINPIGKTSLISSTPPETTPSIEKSSKRHHAYHSCLPTSHSSNDVKRKVYRRYLRFWNIGRKNWRQPRVFRSGRICYTESSLHGLLGPGAIYFLVFPLGEDVLKNRCKLASPTWFFIFGLFVPVILAPALILSSLSTNIFSSRILSPSLTLQRTAKTVDVSLLLMYINMRSRRRRGQRGVNPCGLIMIASVANIGV